MDYQIETFLLHKAKEYYVVQTKTTTILVTNYSLFKMLEYIERENISILNDDVVRKFFDPSEMNELYEFLQREQLIKKIAKRVLKFDNVVLITNNVEFDKAFSHNMEKKFRMLTYYKPEDVLNDISLVESADCIFIFLNPFNQKEYEKLNVVLYDKDLLLKNMFFYNNSIYISNYTKKSWLNPCPLCFFSILESRLRGVMNQNNYNFQTIIDIIYSKNPRFKIEAELNSYDYIPVFYTLILQFNNLKSSIDEIYEINLDTYKISCDYAYHWEVCDCYE